MAGRVVLLPEAPRQPRARHGQSKRNQFARLGRPMSMTTIIAPLLAEATPERVSQYVRLFVVVASLLGILMLGIVLFGYLRRRRLASMEREAAKERLRVGREESPDAWSEAGRRDAPFTETTPRDDAREE